MNTQLNEICSRKRPSFLRANTKEEIANFDFEKVCLEWKERAPIFYAFLMTCAAIKKEKAPEWLPSVAVSGSILLKQRNSHMNGCATVIGILIKSRSLEATMDRLAKLKITCSNVRIRAKFDLLGENHGKEITDLQLKRSKEEEVVAEKEKRVVTLVEICSSPEHTCSPQCVEDTAQAKRDAKEAKLNMSTGFAIAFDNIDGRRARKHMTKDNQNLDFHWVNHKIIMVKKQVENSVFSYQEGRSYRHFKGFERDALANLNMSKCYTWINDHKNKFSSGVKA